ncbi:Prolyl-tRNA editing protein ProX [bacterium HR36]|nr:Prolyl-tRNA editing protein ProX [bacterium HR36]
MSILDRIRERVQAAGVEVYSWLFHRPVYTSEEAATVRGTPLATGAKALLLKADDRFILAVLPAERKLDNRRLREHLGVKSLRFASREELLQITGVLPGAVPPFGSLFGLQTYCDPTLLEQPEINFNAGDNAVSMLLGSADYSRVEKPIPLPLAS